MKTKTQVAAGGWFTLKISNRVRVAAQNRQKFRQFAAPVDDFAAGMGDTYQWPKLFDMPGYGEYVGEMDDVPDGDFSIGSGSVTVRELTRSTSLSQPASLYSELSIVDAAQLVLMNNWYKSIDRICGNAFKTCDLVYTPTGTVTAKTYTLTNTGTAGAIASRPFSLWDLRRVTGIMEDYNIPGYKGDDYMCISASRSLQYLREDHEFFELKKYQDPDGYLQGEIGRTERVRFIGENNVLNNNLTSELGEMVFFGDDPVVEVEVYPFELQAASLDVWGRFRSMRYTWIGGFAPTWVQADGQYRVLKVSSL